MGKPVILGGVGDPLNISCRLFSCIQFALTTTTTTTSTTEQQAAY